MQRLREGPPIDDAHYYEYVWSEEYNTRPFYDAVRMRELAKKVRCGDTVIDVGAGVFGTVQYIVEHQKNLEIFPVCYDQSYTARNIVITKFPEILYFLGMLPETYLPPDSFDVVVAGEIIEHMEEPDKFAAELTRICRPGGWISISTVDVTSENAIKHGEYPEHLWSFDKKDLIDLFKFTGSVQYVLCGDYHVVHVHKGIK
jgi:2-polyprenyl-3-methyl-5-hydroxy-6-metoxy-1,4-benzoquinol methylase